MRVTPDRPVRIKRIMAPTRYTQNNTGAANVGNSTFTAPVDVEP
jgi:hypothetical protein